MPRFTIEERLRVTVEAEDAQTAVDTWLAVGEPCAVAIEVHNRDVEDEHGNVVIPSAR